MTTSESLTAHFKELHAERVRTLDPVKLEKNIRTRADLVASFDPAKIAQVGDVLDPVDLTLSDGTRTSLDALLEDGATLLIFFRSAGCPACNLALPYYDRQVRPALDKVGIRLVAVSPQLPERGLSEIKIRHGLGFPIASDRDNVLARRLGITYAKDEVPQGVQTPGWTGDFTGTGTAELPQPAVVLIDQDRTIRFIDVSPDWLVRTEAPAILAAAELSSAPASA